MTLYQDNSNNILKLPTKLVEFLNSIETNELVGFGSTHAQQDLMLFMALLYSQNPDNLQELKKEIDDYFSCLNQNLADNLTE